MNPFYTPQFGTLTFDILTRETVFLEVGRVVGGLRYLKRCLQELTFSLPAVLRSLAFSLLARSFRSPALTESQAQVSTGTPHDNLTECYLCHAIRQALVDIVVYLRNHVIGLILQLVANLFTTFQAFLCVLLFLFQKRVFADDLKIFVKSSGCESPRHCVFTMTPVDFSTEEDLGPANVFFPSNLSDAIGLQDPQLKVEIL